MMIKSVIKSTWAEDMGQFLYHTDPNSRKISRRLEKLQLKMINKQYSIVFNKTYLNIYMCVCVCVCVQDMLAISL